MSDNTWKRLRRIQQFEYDGSLDQKFILDNSYIDTSTLKVYINPDTDELGIEYFLADDIIDVTSKSQIYLLQEVQDEKYQLLFGDGIIGKKLGTGPNHDGKPIISLLVEKKVMVLVIFSFLVV